MAMKEKAEAHEESSLRERILDTADKRIKATDVYLQDHNMTRQDLAVQLAAEPFKIQMNVEDPKSVVGAIFDLQTQLGFKQKDYREGCDGMYGAFTDYMCKKRTVVSKVHVDSNRVLTDNADINSKATVIKNNLDRSFALSSVRAVGDSLMVGVSGFIATAQGSPANFYKENKYAKVGRQLAPLSLNGKKREGNESVALQALQDPTCALLLVNGGENDLDVHISNDPSSADTSSKTAERIIESFSRIIEAAHQKGKRVGIFLLHGLKHGKSQSIKGQRIENAVAQVNEWLRTSSGADLLIDPNNLNESMFSKKDGLHWNTQASRHIAENFLGAIRG